MSSDYNRPNSPKLTPVKAIRAFCTDCVCGSVRDVETCPDGGCALHPYRMGRNPHMHDRPGNTEALRAYREASVTL
jgi:hypothetical protein